MINVGEWLTIKTLYIKSYSIKKISRLLHKSINTIGKYLKNNNNPEYAKTEKYIPKTNNHNMKKRSY